MQGNLARCAAVWICVRSSQPIRLDDPKFPAQCLLAPHRAVVCRRADAVAAAGCIERYKIFRDTNDSYPRDNTLKRVGNILYQAVKFCLNGDGLTNETRISIDANAYPGIVSFGLVRIKPLTWPCERFFDCYLTFCGDKH